MRWPDRLLLDDNFREMVSAEARARGIPIPRQHVVVMDAKGLVLDPFPGNEHKQGLEDYKDVFRVIGVTEEEVTQLKTRGNDEA